MTKNIFEALGIREKNGGTIIGLRESFDNKKIKEISSFSPANNRKLADVTITSREEFNQTIFEARKAFKEWRKVPPPQRGDIIRQYGDILRKHKSELGQLVSREMGKSLQEGKGEVQEMIDICDYAVGLSRQLYGKTIASERPNHHMLERWHPLGIVGIISAFNFPVAVWSWNAMIALVCGNVCVWKPSEKTPLCAIACQNLLVRILRENGINTAISSVINGDRTVGNWMTSDPAVNLVSATGSIRMGREVAVEVGKRLGKLILELGGNNAMIISPQANMDLALNASVFGAIGTAGQRCTSTRRLIIHDSIYDDFVDKLKNAYKQINVGDPLDEDNHMGPLIDQDAVDNYLSALNQIRKEGGKFIVEGGLYTEKKLESNFYVKPCVAEISPDANIVREETFAPILYVLRYNTFEEALTIQNSTSQGLSSSIITENVREAEYFISSEGSDCGIANVNIGTSGAEIGGAFGGEKDTGGGRESGSDAWKVYMRRQTITINFGSDIPLAQGISFDF
ncbi:L-piperidine-6-carboxylate dehydrogenase [Membranihabitans maritimus]|uniref:L-piperidine-6-carboxylate dehydrogenase n=1 Tax=Membranihabitans maritimus TaxID=2904244 RepID=UPI001F185DDA|nr:aldehyde dehydrogenase family protein [Membranihabitans maritimus]